MRAWAGIVGVAVMASVIYGIAHDLVTAHICPEYFLPPYHPDLIGASTALPLALFWGVWATWWAGAIGGLFLAAVCRIGRWQPLEARRLVRPAAINLTLLWGLVMVLGLAIYYVGGIALKISEKATELDRRLVVVASMHMVSYSGSVIVVMILSVWALLKRRKLSAKAKSKKEGTIPL